MHSPVNATDDDQPDLCPECGSTTFTYEEDCMEYHGASLSMGPVWRCTGCKWGQRALT